LESWAVFPLCVGLSVFRMVKSLCQAAAAENNYRSGLSVLKILLFLLLMFPVLIQPGLAGVTESQAQLKKIQARINRTEKQLQSKKKSELNLSRELAVIRRSLKQIDRQVAVLKKDIAKLEKAGAKQKQLIASSRKNIKKIESQLKKRFVALYKEGDVGALKILFAADSATEMVQQYQYLSRILKHDKELLKKHREAMDVHRRQLDELAALKKKKVDLLAEVQHQRQVAAKGRQLQARLLQKARRDKNLLAGELTQLKQNARRLKQLITQLERQSTAPAGPVAGNFAVGRGKLGWPVNGRVVIGFGQQRDKALGTFYESNGLEIAVPPGSPIRAVAAGKIVFADYFKGYGNLFILSHPGGYHTLYAQVGQMIKKLGEHVSAGDILGKSGLDGRDSIYFEIRSNGSPVNPLAWLKRR